MTKRPRRHGGSWKRGCGKVWLRRGAMFRTHLFIQNPGGDLKILRSIPAVGWIDISSILTSHHGQSQSKPKPKQQHFPGVTIVFRHGVICMIQQYHAWVQLPHTIDIHIYIYIYIYKLGRIPIFQALYFKYKNNLQDRRQREMEQLSSSDTHSSAKQPR